MKLLFGKPWTSEERKSMKPTVFANIVQNMKQMVCYVRLHGIKVELMNVASEIDGLAEDAPVDAALAAKIKLLWRDQGIQTAWKERSKFQVLDCLEYFCNNIDRIGKSDYLPNEMDILQARMRTSGIVEEKYVIDEVQFNMFDVGGQRNERKKWIHCFDNVTAVVFVAAINEYDQVLFEDNHTSRIDEALKLFEEICNSPWFKRTSMILFLNKNDIFEEKLFKYPLRIPGERYDDFKGPYANEPGVSKAKAIDAAQQYLLKLFLSKNQNEEKEIYHHITCATDTRNIELVFAATRDIILKANLNGYYFE